MKKGKRRKEKQEDGEKKEGKERNSVQREHARDNVRYVGALCQRAGRRGAEKGGEWEQIERWQHMRARDSHGAPFVRVSATQLVTVYV